MRQAGPAFKAWLGAQRTLVRVQIWVGVTINPSENRRFESLLSFTWVSFWVLVLDPHPYVAAVRLTPYENKPGFFMGESGWGLLQKWSDSRWGPLQKPKPGAFSSTGFTMGTTLWQNKKQDAFLYEHHWRMRVIPFRTSTTRKRVLGYGSNSCLKGSHLKANSHHKEVPSLFGGDEAQSSFLKLTGSRGHPHESWGLCDECLFFVASSSVEQCHVLLANVTAVRQEKEAGA